MTDATRALQRLSEGNRRFVAGESDATATVRHGHVPGFAPAQKPVAIVLACSDARVPTELIFDQGIGDLFVIRVAGNVVAPSQVGSVEFAAQQFGTPLVVVLGHSHCGAVKATLDELAKKEDHRSPNLRAIVDRIRPAIEPLLEEDVDHDSNDFVNAAVRANVLASVERLRHGSIIIEDLIDSGDLKIVGAEYSIESGTVEFLPEQDSLD